MDSDATYADPTEPEGTDHAPQSFLRRNRLAVGVAGVVGTAVVAWLAFGYFGIHTLWIDEEVNEAGPVFESGARADDGAATADEGEGEEAGYGDTTGAQDDTPVIETVASGQFSGRAKSAEGTATVLTDGTEQRFLRFTEFATENGPDVEIYLSTAAPDAPEGEFDDDFVSLGRMQGNIGDQNYEIPPGVDLDRYSTVVIWCVRFTSAFGVAPLDQA